MNTRYTGARRLALSSITLAVLAMMNQAAAQEIDPNAPMARVEVTGSSIKRLANEEALPITSIKADDIVKQGMTTLADVMMALPQSASLAPSNAGSGTNINLRGLGVNRTLVLLNGRRLANEAIADGYANLDVIPISALERVEVLRDGASSIYGSDAIGGVVNFITKRSVTGGSITAQYVQPEKHGGADEQRLSATYGKGDLQKDGWNVYATVDAHRRSRLLAADRAELSTDEMFAWLGRPRTLGNGGYATPANYTSSANKSAANPYYASGCLAPYSVQGGKNTCILNNNEYGTAIHANKQVTFYAKATKKIGEDHTVALEYARGEASIFGAKNPTQAVAVGSDKPYIYATSPWYPGGSGGVPAMANATGQPLLVSWAVADHGAALTRDTQLNQRLALTADGIIGAWDYKAGLTYGVSKRDGYYQSGYFSGPGLIQGLADGTLNPFGLQDEAGAAYLDQISADGMHNRTSQSTYSGVDATFSRPLMALAGGDASIAIGADFHRDTNEDTKLPEAADITYAKSVPAHGEGARNIAGLFGEIDMPVSKQLDVDMAIRADKFSDFGTTVNPKVSFRYQPNSVVMFRGSANSGFRAPTLFDRYGYRTPGANKTTSGRWDDPVLCPGGIPGQGGTGTALPGYNEADVCNAKLDTRVGSNPNLKPETSRGGTLGIVLQPTRSLNMSFDYWLVQMKDMLANLPEQSYFMNYDTYKDLFVRNPDGTLAYIDNVTMNLAGQKAAGIDVSGTYLFPHTDYGDFKVSLDGTYLTRFDNQLEPDGPWVSNVGQFGVANNGTTSSLPIITFRWKHTLRVSWTRGNWSSTLTENHNSAYTDQNLVPEQYYRNISPYSVFNWTMTYKGFKHVAITAGITNLFDEDPPVTNHKSYGFGYLSSAASPIGRAYNLRVSYHF